MSGDYIPTASAFALRWSPWTRVGDSRVASLAYISHSYIGFRKITLKNEWETSSEPKLEIGDADNVGICLGLRTDAFLEWEDFVRITPACAPLMLTCSGMGSG